MRPTRGTALSLLVAVVLHRLSAITGSGWLTLGAGAALALPVAGLLLPPRLRDLDVVVGPVRTRVGSTAEVRVVVRNAGTRASAPARLAGSGTGLAPVVLALPSLAPGARVEAVLVREALTRGSWPRVAVELTSSAPFGTVRVRRVVEVAGPVVVAPAPRPAPVLRAGGAGHGSTSTAGPGAGTEVLGLRQFRDGDGRSAVHARATARHGRPVVLERERETGPSSVLLCAGPGEGAAWEQVVGRACALAEALVRDGRPPRLLAAGAPAPVRPTAAAVLDWHAGLDAAQPLDAGTLTEAVRTAARGGSVVLLAPAPDVVGEVRRACTAAGAQLTVLG